VPTEPAPVVVERGVGDAVGDAVVGELVVDGVEVRLVGVALPAVEAGRVAVTVTVRTEVRVTVTVDPLGSDASMRSSRQAR
jgi:hypothetical protein